MPCISAFIVSIAHQKKPHKQFRRKLVQNFALYINFIFSFLVTLNKSWHTLINNSIFSLTSYAVKTSNILIVSFQDRLAKMDSILVSLFIEYKNTLWRNMMRNVHCTFSNSLNQTITIYLHETSWSMIQTQNEQCIVI